MSVTVIYARNGRGKEMPFIVDGDYDGELLATYKWRIHQSEKRKYVVCTNGDYKGMQLSRILMPSAKKNQYVIHKNGNDLDYRSENLMLVDKSEFLRETMKKTNPTQYRKNRGTGPQKPRGKTKDNPSSRYYNVIKDRGAFVVLVHQKYYGMFKDEEKAADMADRAKIEIYGYEVAKDTLNFPEKWRKIYE